MPDRSSRSGACPATRDAYVNAVGRHLNLPDEMARGVLDELADHLRDATEELRARGLSDEDSERRAIGRLGDASELGGELSRARHDRRQVWAAVGGGIRGLIVEGIRTWIFMSLLLAGAFLLALPLAAAVLHAQGRSSASYLTGPGGSVLTVLLVCAGAAYLGWVLPARVARPAIRSVRAVRRAVAVAGLAAGSALVWLAVEVDMDPVLALGLPLAPLAFAVAAGRAPERPTCRIGLIPVGVGIILLFVPTAIFAVLTATDSGQVDFFADTSVIGAPLDTSAPTVNVSSSSPWSGDPSGEVTVEFADPTVAARFTSVRVEVWPARIADGVIQFGRGPIATVVEPVSGVDATIGYRVPRLRTAVTTATFVVGVRVDGGRTVISEDFDLQPTPPWRGTLLDWWTGRP